MYSDGYTSNTSIAPLYDLKLRCTYHLNKSTPLYFNGKNLHSKLWNEIK